MKYFFNKKVFLTAITDLLPVFVFIVFFKLFTFFETIVAVIIATIISFFLATIKEKRIPIFMLFATIITIIFNYVALFFESTNVLKLKETVFDFTSGTILLLGLIVFKKILLKDFFRHIFHFTDNGWKVLTYFWIIYFYIGTIIDEIIRHSKHPNIDDYWIIYKIVNIPFTAIWAIITIYYVKKKYSLENSEDIK